MTSPLFEVFRTVLMNKPYASRAELIEDFVAEMLSDDVFFDLLARDYFERMAAVHVTKNGRLGHTFSRTDVSADRVARQREAAKSRRDSAVSELKSKLRDVLLLDLVMPDGKKLREATGAECAKAGGFYAEIAKHIKPTQVVDKHMSEADLRNVRSRFYQEEKEKAA